MNCPGCGEDVSGGARFCPACERFLPPDKPPPSLPETHLDYCIERWRSRCFLSVLGVVPVYLVLLVLSMLEEWIAYSLGLYPRAILPPEWVNVCYIAGMCYFYGFVMLGLVPILYLDLLHDYAFAAGGAALLAAQTAAIYYFGVWRIRRYGECNMNVPYYLNALIGLVATFLIFHLRVLKNN